ncbi:hypothetical protein C9F11_45045 (plasmid) [Streptomyces sp. YIM 121038]|nr:hypothetical protein C9F11_45045 [Streptomyces sp. YIM 121038]
MPGELGQLPAVFTADGSEKPPHIVPHPTPQVRAAEAVANAQEESVEFPLPGHVRMLVDHLGRLSAPESASQILTHTWEGRSGQTTPDPRPNHYTPDDAFDQAR